MIFCNGRTLPSQVEAIIHGSFLSTVHMISEMVHHFGNPEGNGYEYVADLHSDQVFYTLGFLKDTSTARSWLVFLVPRQSQKMNGYRQQPR